MSTSPLEYLAVFAASRPGLDEAFVHAAKSLGHAVARSGKGIIYGGGDDGLMGTVSNSALEADAPVIGIIPLAMLDTDTGAILATMEIPKEEPFQQLILKHDSSRMTTIVVHTTHDRKTEMEKRASAFVALPGGFGTYEELFEIITWVQIGIHDKPIFIMNILGYYDMLRNMIKMGIRNGFIPSQHEELFVFVDGPQDHNLHETYDWGSAVIDGLKNWKKPHLERLYDWSKRVGEIRKKPDSCIEESPVHSIHNYSLIATPM